MKHPYKQVAKTAPDLNTEVAASNLVASDSPLIRRRLQWCDVELRSS